MQDDKTVFMPISQNSVAPKKVSMFDASFAPKEPQVTSYRSQHNNPAQQGIWPPLQEITYQSGMNTLLLQATEIFIIHYHLLHGHLTQIEQLRASIHDALIKFEMRAQELNFPKPLIKSAKYVLCAFLDEAVMSQEFTRESQWSQQSLLSRFFNETWGGATVFKIRQFCLENLQDYIDLLELIYLVLCLGFKGQFGTLENGDVQLDRLKRETYQVIMNVRGDLSNMPLSPHAATDYEGKVTLKQTQSLWWVIGSCLSILFITYIALSVFLSIESAPVYAKVMSLVSGAAT